MVFNVTFQVNCRHVTSQVVKTWRKELSKINAKAAESLADPGQYSNLFPDLDLALKAEQHQREQRKQSVPAQDFQDYEGSTMANLIEEIRGEGQRGRVHDGCNDTITLRNFFFPVLWLELEGQRHLPHVGGA